MSVVRLGPKLLNTKEKQMLRSLLLASLATATLASAASAQDSHFNVGGGYTRVEIGELEFDAFSLRGGYDFNENFGVEAQFDLGMGDDSLTIAGNTANIDLNYSAAIYGIGRLPVSENANLFARIGYATTELEASAVGVLVSDSDDGFSFGVGGEYFFDDFNGLRFDYTRTDYSDGDDDADSIGISYVRRFGG
jgi:outer membrane immunogenic protein